MTDDKACCGQHQGHWAVKLTAILALCAIIIVAMLRDKIVNNQFRQITAMGQGKVTYVPDTATVTLGVQIDKMPQADQALGTLNSRMDKVLAAIKAAGVPEADINTRNYSLVPQYDYKDNVSTVGGYNANQQLSVKIKDLQNNRALLNKVIAEAGKAGANQVNGINFEAANMDDIKQEARVKAIADAKSKAAGLAQAAGVRLGKIMNWYENFVKGGTAYGSYYEGGIGGGGGGAPMPQVSINDNEVIVEIGVSYQIK